MNNPIQPNTNEISESLAHETDTKSRFDEVKNVGKDFSEIVKGVLSAKEEEQIQSKMADLGGNTDAPKTTSQLIVSEGGVFIDPSMKGRKIILLDAVDETDKNKELIVPDPDGKMPDLDYKEKMKTEKIILPGDDQKSSGDIVIADKNGNIVERKKIKKVKMSEKIKSFFGFGSPESTPKSKIITDLTADTNPKPLQLPNPDGTFDNDPTKSSTGKKTTIVPGFTPKVSAVPVETDKSKTSQTLDSTPKSEVKKDLKLEDLFKENKGGNAKESKENVSKGSSHPEKQNSRESSSYTPEKKTPEKNENKSDKKPETKKESKPFWTPERKKKWKENFQKFTKDLGVVTYGFGKWGIVGAGITAGVLIPASLFVAGVSMPLATSIITANGLLMGSAGAIKEYVDHKKKEKESKNEKPSEKANPKKGQDQKDSFLNKVKKPFDAAAETIRGWFTPKKK